MPRERSVVWPEAARQLAAALPRERLHPAVLAWAETSSPRATWAIAFSGGPDSLALLLLLWAHWPERRARLVALHFDHRMRGAESRRDAVFCRRVCAALGVKFIAGRWPGDHRGASEAEAREARLSFFHEQARAIWFGHQQDDVAESMLMRLARGSGAGGLAAPRPVQTMPGGRVHVRPLLSLKKAEIVAALEAARAPWREDSSNAAGVYFRNRIRRDILPAWIAAAGRDALAGAARARELLEEDEAALEAWLAEIAPWKGAGALRLEPLADKPRALVRRALHRWLRGISGPVDLSRQAFDALLAAVERGRPTRHSLGPTTLAVITQGELRVEKIHRAGRIFRRRTN